MREVRVFTNKKDAEAEAARNSRAKMHERVQYNEKGEAKREYVVVLRNRNVRA